MSYQIVHRCALLVNSDSRLSYFQHERLCGTKCNLERKMTVHRVHWRIQDFPDERGPQSLSLVQEPKVKISTEKCMEMTEIGPRVS